MSVEHLPPPPPRESVRTELVNLAILVAVLLLTLVALMGRDHLASFLG